MTPATPFSPNPCRCLLRAARSGLFPVSCHVNQSICSTSASLSVGSPQTLLVAYLNVVTCHIFSIAELGVGAQVHVEVQAFLTLPDLTAEGGHLDDHCQVIKPFSIETAVDHCVEPTSSGNYRPASIHAAFSPCAALHVTEGSNCTSSATPCCFLAADADNKANELLESSHSMICSSNACTLAQVVGPLTESTM